VNTLTDFLLAFLPVPLIWKLQVNVRTRLTLLFILSLGLFAGVAGIMRASVFNSILKDPRRYIHDKYSRWNYVELTIGIIAGSLPALKPLFNMLFNAARGVTTGGSTRASGYKNPQSLGYHRNQSNKSESGIALGELNTGNRTSIMSPRAQAIGADKTAWGGGRASDSDESILPLHGTDDQSKSIVVTSAITITDH